MGKVFILILSLAWAQSSFVKYHCYAGKSYLGLELIKVLPGDVELKVRKDPPLTAYSDFSFWAGKLNGRILTDYDGSKIIVASGNLSSSEGKTYDHYSSIAMNLSKLTVEETISGSYFKTQKVQWKCKFAK